jgi:hypothetical protein
MEIKLNGGERIVDILFALRDLKIIDSYAPVFGDNNTYQITIKPEQPTFSVGMRVELKKRHPSGAYTDGMVYRLGKWGEPYFFSVIDDDGKKRAYSLEELQDYFKPYEKPIEGENYYMIVYSAEIRFETWENTDRENEHWNLGLAFREKEQAEFARERLSKLF